MTEKCFDEGTIQAFLDGELGTDLLETVARHTAACNDCALLLAEAESESAFAFSALGEEFNTLVPTERIRTGLYSAISQIEKPQRSLWAKIFGEGFSLTNPSVAAFASLLLVVGLFTALFIYRTEPANQVAEFKPAKSSQQPSVKVNPPVAAPVIPDDEVAVSNDLAAQNDEDIRISSPRARQAAAASRINAENRVTIEKASLKVQKSKVAAEPEIDNRQPQMVREALLGEENYVKTIATLTDSVNTRKDNVLRPSERVAFEKDLAVVDDVIKKMRRVVRTNPKNEAAKQVLRSSYENKIDLLNSVAEKTELMATLR
jgi:anti-sigma factor RsiW